ncbi:MAG: magnesium transporter CorA family protein [Asticcacaulis sp.]|uniref:magnesium transporter CorA family protein n=1 Tax=Asticcacaulis sp. TaxID=1872648 RepID=UPI0039E4AC3B
MMTAYYRDQDVLKTALLARVKENHGDILTRSVWIDLQNPVPEEERYLRDHLAIAIPSRAEIWRNQALNRLYTESGTTFMTAAILHKINSAHPKTSAVTFILTDRCLVTIRHIAPTSFSHFQQRLLNHPEAFQSGPEVMEGLMQEMFMRVAWHMEMLVDGLDDLSRRIFDDHAFENKQGNPSIVMRRVLQKLGGLNDLNSKIHESLQSLERMLIFFRKAARTDQVELKEDLDLLILDADALLNQTNFLSDKINFQLDAALGMINVEQNLISKIFSIVAVFFLPPTLISSIYGMNFAHMPELHWQIGYPVALGLMVAVSSLTYIHFKRQGWL